MQSNFRIWQTIKNSYNKCIYNIYIHMGKLDIGLRTGNTIVTPLRIWGEIGNALANIPRQWISGLKNIAEVTTQTRDALVDNFKNFSKVEGKRYQRVLKWWVNLASACTRRPMMIAGAGIASGLNQWILQPFKKLLLDTPSKLFKGLKNAVRIFSKKKGFDFQSHETHETKWDTWVNQFKEKSLGFAGVKAWSSEKKVEDIIVNPGNTTEAKPIEIKTEEKKKILEESKKVFEDHKKIRKERKAQIDQEEDELLTETYNTDDQESEKINKESDKINKESEKQSKEKLEKKEDKQKSKSKTIADVKEKSTKESAAKDQAEVDAKLWKNLDKESKADYEKFIKTLLTHVNKQWVMERAKKYKKWKTMEEIIATLKKENNHTMASYIEDVILAKEKSAK